MKSRPIDLKSLYLDKIPKRGYLTHGFDNYPAKMIPHMARFLIDEISKPGQTVLDPFCGSGAVLVESLLSGRNAVGVDLNPLAILFAKAKTTVYDPKFLETQLEEILRQFALCHSPYQYKFPNASYWFTPATLRKFGAIKAVLDSYLPNIDPDYAFFWKAMLAAIVRECSRADTRGPKPFISKKARQTRVGKHFNPFKAFESKAHLWISVEHLYDRRFERNGSKPQIRLIEDDARGLSRLFEKEIIDAVVTSPPYLSAQDYYRASKLQLFILGHSSPAELREHSRELIGSDRILHNDALLNVKLPSSMADTIRFELAKHNRKSASVFAKYVLDMSKVLNEISRVLKTDAHCVIVSGYNLISSIVVPTPEVIVELAEREGFQLMVCYADRIRDRWVPTIRNGHNGVIDQEYLLVFRKIR